MQLRLKRVCSKVQQRSEKTLRKENGETADVPDTRAFALETFQVSSRFRCTALPDIAISCPCGVRATVTSLSELRKTVDTHAGTTTGLL